jgi:hypothetical protein
MGVRKGHPGETGEVMFRIRDPELRYSLDQVVAILAKADEMNLPMEKGSYLESMTIRQLDNLVNGKADC